VTIQDAAKLAKHANVANAKRFAKHVVPEVVRPARVVWNQAIGALFIVLAIPAGLKALQAYRDLPSDPKSGFGLALSCIFFVVMLSFGVASFLKARKIASRVNRF
jgi:hypothetical protein